MTTSGRAAKTSVDLMQCIGLKVQRTATPTLLRCAAPLSQNLVLHATDVLAALPLVVLFKIIQLLDNQIASSQINVLFFSMYHSSYRNQFWPFYGNETVMPYLSLISLLNSSPLKKSAESSSISAHLLSSSAFCSAESSKSSSASSFAISSNKKRASSIFSSLVNFETSSRMLVLIIPLVFPQIYRQSTFFTNKIMKGGQAALHNHCPRAPPYHSRNPFNSLVLMLSIVRIFFFVSTLVRGKLERFKIISW